jgi:transcriptional regulator with XRE-family HTH domain
MQAPSESSATLSRVLTEARESGGVGVPAGLSVRQLAKRAGVSAAQVSRIENGQVARPSHEILVALSRALNRNPLPLLILVGHVDAEQARAALAPLFREGAELPEEWGEWARFDIETVRALLSSAGMSDEDLRAIAADVFRVAETDETLWDDSYELAMARGESAGELRELMSIWRYIPGHRHELLEYGRALRRLADLEYLAESHTDALTSRGHAGREPSS